MSAQSFSKVISDTTVVGYGTIPLATMFLSVYAQAETSQKILSLRPNSGGEIFSFTAALDATLLISKSAVINRINPSLASNFEVWLVLLLISSFVMLIFAGRTQCRIRRAARTKHYPFIGVATCWIVGLTFVSTHLFLLIGK